MNDTDLKDIWPSLRKSVPQTFWISVVFGTLNIVIGMALFNYVILTRLYITGLFSLRAWAVAFFLHGLFMMVSLLVNNWNMTRVLHGAGLALKLWWCVELLAAWINGSSPFVFMIWLSLLAIQFSVYQNFSPRLGRG